MRVTALAVSFALIAPLTQAFVPPPSTSSTTALQSTNELFDSPGWGAIRDELDQVPIFAVANAEGQPLKYSVQLAKKNDDGEDMFEVPLFYTHVEDALKELEIAKENTPLPGMDMYVTHSCYWFGRFVSMKRCSMQPPTRHD